LLGVSESTLRRWLREGIPAVRRAAVRKLLKKVAKKKRPAKKVAKKRPAKKVAKKKRPAKKVAKKRLKKKVAKKRLKKKVAKKRLKKKPSKKKLSSRDFVEKQLRRLTTKAIQAGYVKLEVSRSRKYEGPRTYGFQYSKRVNQLVDPGLIDELEAWVLSLPEDDDWNHWLVVMTVSQLITGADKEGVSGAPFKGYRTVMYGSPAQFKTFEKEPLMENFSMKSQLTTSRGPRGAVLGQMVELLEGVSTFEEAGDGQDVAYAAILLSITAYNYRSKSDEERRAYETRARRARAKPSKGMMR